MRRRSLSRLGLPSLLAASVAVAIVALLLIGPAAPASAGAPALAEAPVPAQAASTAGTVQPPSPVVCNGSTIGFDSGIPSDWTVVDNAGNGVNGTTVAASGEGGNWTGGGGDAASVSSDSHFLTEFDTELHTPTFSLAGFSGATLTYLANYWNLANRDFLKLDISTNGGTQWNPVLSWNENHGSFRAVPGELVSVDLSAYAGLSNLLLRWHYYDPNTNDWDWYAQIDNVALSCTEAIGPA